MRYEKKRLERAEMIARAGRENDQSVLETLGSQETYNWHEARKTVDADHVNPYIMHDRKRALDRAQSAQNGHQI